MPGAGTGGDRVVVEVVRPPRSERIWSILTLLNDDLLVCLVHQFLGLQLLNMLLNPL